MGLKFQKSRKKKLTVAEAVAAIRVHADTVFFKIPTGEQFMGARDTVFHSAMNAIADALERLESK
jgi:hypothetical protein